MIIAEKGIVPDILMWRGDISAYTFDLKLVNTTSGVVTIFEGLNDMTPSRHTIKLMPPSEVWHDLPSGEYEYYVENNGSILYAGLLKNNNNIESDGYSTDNTYIEYRA